MKYVPVVQAAAWTALCRNVLCKVPGPLHVTICLSQMGINRFRSSGWTAFKIVRWYPTPFRPPICLGKLVHGIHQTWPNLWIGESPMNKRIISPFRVTFILNSRPFSMDERGEGCGSLLFGPQWMQVSPKTKILTLCCARNSAIGRVPVSDATAATEEKI